VQDIPAQPGHTTFISKPTNNSSVSIINMKKVLYLAGGGGGLKEIKCKHRLKLIAWLDYEFTMYN
jgi:hypothetical protein